MTTWSTKEILVRAFCELQEEQYNETGEVSDKFVIIEHSDCNIMNPFKDVTGRFDVNPTEYYGEEIIDMFFREIALKIGRVLL